MSPRLAIAVLACFGALAAPAAAHGDPLVNAGPRPPA
jgi:hypothetical protein